LDLEVSSYYLTTPLGAPLLFFLMETVMNIQTNLVCWRIAIIKMIKLERDTDKKRRLGELLLDIELRLRRM